MMRHRIIPTLLLNNGGLYKTRKFKDPIYIGDPVNTLKIFNTKEVDEIVLLDIGLSRSKKQPNLDLLSNLASECFMPLSYGGGIDNIAVVKNILSIGIEKVIINSAAYRLPEFITSLSDKFGSSTIVGSIDVRTSIFGGKRVYIDGGTKKIPYSPVDWAIELERRGVGELLINSIDKDGMQSGYDSELIAQVSKSVSVPVIASGGAGSIKDIHDVVKLAGASAAAAGSIFVFQGKHRAVLIKYPTEEESERIWGQ